VPTTDGEPRYIPVETPLDLMQKIEKYQAFLKDLRDELIEDVKLVEQTVIDPLSELKKYMEPARRMLKRREGKKLDYERYHRDVENLKKKRARTDKENMSLQKAEQHMEATQQVYQAEDERLIEWAPPFLARISEAISLLLQTLITAQVQVLARSYTVFLNYSQSSDIQIHQTDHVVEEWEELFEPIKRHLESEIPTIKAGKAVRMPMNQLVASKAMLPVPGKFKRSAPPPPPPPNPPAGAKPLIGRTQTSPPSSSYASSERTLTGPPPPPPPIPGSGRPPLRSTNTLPNYQRDESPPPPLPSNKPPPSRDGIRPQKSFSNLSVYEGASRNQGYRVPSGGSVNLAVGNSGQDGKPDWARLRPTSSSSRYSTNSDNAPGYAATESSATSYEDTRSQISGTVTKSSYGRASGNQLNNAIENSLVAKLNSRPGTAATNQFLRPVSPGAQSVSSTGTSASAIAAKKKPPPPPPKPKMIKKEDDGYYVIALYTFQAQAAGDLGFKEGDRIKVTRKTESTDDWWEGEINGRKGEFPANYTMKQ
jgi:hypothetical protein